MPTPLYICDFCAFGPGSFDEIIEHEDDCIFDPINRNCVTCRKFYSNEGKNCAPLRYGKLQMHCDIWLPMNQASNK